MMQAVIQCGSSVHRIPVQGVLSKGGEQGEGNTRAGGNWAECVREGTGGGRGTRQKIAQIKSCTMYFWLMPLQNWLKVVFWNFSVPRIPFFCQPKKSIGRRINIQILIAVTK